MLQQKCHLHDDCDAGRVGAGNDELNDLENDFERRQFGCLVRRHQEN
jgi:hypothetical protein